MDPLSGMIAVGAGIAIAGGSIGTGLAQKDIGAAAVGATAENPKMFGRSIVFLVLPETLVIFGFVVAAMLWLKMV
jgi:V/A-type H+-transporting ATPase subunit K